MANQYHDFTAAPIAKHGFEALNEGMGGLGDTLAAYFQKQKDQELAVKNYITQKEIDSKYTQQNKAAEQQGEFDMEGKRLSRAKEMYPEQFPGAIGNPIKEQANFNPLRGVQSAVGSAVSGQRMPAAPAPIVSGGQFNPVQAEDQSPFMTRVDMFTGKPKEVRNPLFKTSQDKKFDLELQDRERANKAHTEVVRQSAKDTIDTINTIEKGIGNFGLTGRLPSIPGTARVDWEANINKLLSSRIIDLMRTLKEASKTGASGFGALSEKELKVLQEASTSLNRGMKPEDAQKYLTSMKQMATKVLGDNSGMSNEVSGNNAAGQTFNVGGKTYNIPADKVDAFKKAKGIK